MTQGITPPPERRRLGFTKPASPLWWRRYRSLIAQGFVHREAAQLASGIIGSADMRRGRARREKWYQQQIAKGLTSAQIEAAVDQMYDDYDWFDAYSQFYEEAE